jgi:hypothetical protein
MASVQDARPPQALVKLLNPVNRIVLRSPLARLVKPFALLEFTGRRTGRRYVIPVGWQHTASGEFVVVSPAAWRANFAGGLDVLVHYRGHTQRMIGTLDADADAVAGVIRDVIAGGKRPRDLGLDIPEGHTFTRDDAIAVDRKVIRFAPA